MYQDYAEEVNANSAVFVCDVDKFDEIKFILSFEKRGTKLDKMVLVMRSFLDKIHTDQSLLKKFNTLIKEPRSYSPKQRILA